MLCEIYVTTSWACLNRLAARVKALNNGNTLLGTGSRRNPRRVPTAGQLHRSPAANEDGAKRTPQNYAGVYCGAALYRSVVGAWPALRGPAAAVLLRKMRTEPWQSTKRCSDSYCRASQNWTSGHGFKKIPLHILGMQTVSRYQCAWISCVKYATTWRLIFLSRLTFQSSLQKVDSNSYNSFKEFEADMYLIFNNARAFNEKGKGCVPEAFEFFPSVGRCSFLLLGFADSDCVKWANKIEPNAVTEMDKVKERIDSTFDFASVSKAAPTRWTQLSCEFALEQFQQHRIVQKLSSKPKHPHIKLLQAFLEALPVQRHRSKYLVLRALCANELDTAAHAISSEPKECVWCVCRANARESLLRAHASSLLARLAAMDEDRFFTEPVDTATVPAYLDVIKKPMSFRTMQDVRCSGISRHERAGPLELRQHIC